MANTTYDTIKNMKPAPWSRSTVADGNALNQNFLEPTHQKDLTLAAAIDQVKNTVDGYNETINNISNVADAAKTQATNAISAANEAQNDVTELSAAVANKQDKIYVDKNTISGNGTSGSPYTVIGGGGTSYSFDDVTLSGNGTTDPIGVDTSVIATQDWVEDQAYVDNTKFNELSDVVDTKVDKEYVDDTFQLKGDYITSASNTLSGKPLVLKNNNWEELKQGPNIVISGTTISGRNWTPELNELTNNFNKFKEKTEEEFSATSAWALDTFFPISDYFSAVSGTNSSSEYFKWTGDTLSASWMVKHFNLSFNYAVKPVSASPDFIYSSHMLVGNTPIDDKHYVEGYSDTVNFNVSYNIYNADNKTYKFTFSADDKLSIENLYISCIGFINPRSLSGYFSYVENDTTGNFVDSDGNKFIFVEKFPVG